MSIQAMQPFRIGRDVAFFRLLKGIFAMTQIKDMFRTSVKSALLAGVAGGALALASVDFVAAQGQGQGSGGSESAGGSSGASGGASGTGGSDAGQQGSGGTAGGSRNDAPSGDGEEDDDGDDTPDFAGEKGGNPDRGSTPTSDPGRPEDQGGQPEGVGGGDEDSDRPEWAGTPGGSADRGTPPDAGGGGDLYGDLYVILRDAQGVPILSAEGFVQPIDAEGNLIPIDAEGAILPEYDDLAQEVEFGRLSVSRAPEDVLEGRSEEVLYVLNNATEVSLDPAGRLVVTVDGETRTIDAPLENLSIYIALMEYGYIEGVDNEALDALSFLTDGVKTVEDMEAAATFLAAASDKTGVLTDDEIAYLNLILGIDATTMEGTEVAYSAIDYSAFTYDRATSYEGVTTTILVEQADGSWLPTEIDVYEFVFGDVADAAADGTLEAFTQAADDARVVINYIHEYAVPVPPEEL